MQVQKDGITMKLQQKYFKVSYSVKLLIFMKEALFKESKKLLIDWNELLYNW